MERVIPNETTTTARIPDAKVRQAISTRNEKTRRVKEMDAPRRKLTVSNSCRAGSRWLTGPAKAKIKAAVSYALDKGVTPIR